LFLSGAAGTFNNTNLLYLANPNYVWSQWGGSVGTTSAPANGDIVTCKVGGTGTQIISVNGAITGSGTTTNNGSAYPAYPDTIGAGNGSPGASPIGSSPINGQFYYISIFYGWLSATDQQIVEAQ
jgi:hypothetical protein